MPTPAHASLEDWIARDAIPFSVDSFATFHAAVDRMLASLGPSIQLLGLGEALHGGEEILILRNRLFQRLVESHGYTAIAVESSFPRGHLVNEYIAGRGPNSYAAIMEAGFSHGFGRLEANRELVEWMRQYNADSSHPAKLHFYGFDSPTEMMGTDSPKKLLHFALDYLTSIDRMAGQNRRDQIDPLLGEDAPWENPAAMMDPSQSIGLSPDATALRLETEDLITELQRRRPELIAKSDLEKFLEAERHATHARQLLSYHAGLARALPNRVAELLGLRDLMMADNLLYILTRERTREAQCPGKVFAFAHNSHLKKGIAQWQLGPNLCSWWPAGAHLAKTLAPHYAVLGSAIGNSESNGIAPAQPNTLEFLLTTSPGPRRFIPTHNAQHFPTLPLRSGSKTNATYFTLGPQSFSDFDWLAILDSVTYNRNVSSQ